jgi:hypothetical protein
VSEARTYTASSLAAKNGGRLGLAALAAIVVVGLALRLDYAWEGREPVYDAAAYARIAANLHDGEGFTLEPGATQPASNYSPGLPLLVAGLYELSGGEHERFARIALALIGSLSVVFTYLIGRRLSGPTAGLVGAAAVAIYPALLEYHGMLMSEPLAATLLSGAILAMLWALDSAPAAARAGPGAGRGPSSSHAAGEDHRPRASRAPRWLVPGLLLGGLALIRPEYLAVAILLAAVLVAVRWSAGARVAVTHGMLLLAGIALVVVPWTVRNAIVLDRLVPISTGGGQVLFAGSYLPSGGDPERVGREVLERHPGLTRRLAADLGLRVDFLAYSNKKSTQREAVLARLRLEQILAALAAQRYPDLEIDRALGRIGRERLWEAVSEQPLDYAGFVAAKLWRVWGHGPREVMRRPVWELLHLALVGFGLVGLIVLIRRRRWEALPLAVLLLAITAVGVLLVASPRRFLVLLPLVAALAGLGATALWTGIATRPSARRADSLPP